MSSSSWLSSLVSTHRRPRARLLLEVLEDRCVPFTHNWTGLSNPANGNWSDAANWDAVRGAPAVGEADPIVIVFNAATNNKATTQNIPNLIVDTIRFEADGYSINLTQTLTLRDGPNPGGPPVNPQIVSSDGTTSVISGGILINFTNGVNQTTSPQITVGGNASATTLTISSVIASQGLASTLAKDGPGTLILSGANTFTGNFSVNSGTVRVLSPAALGTTAGNTTINEGTTLDVQANIGTEPITATTGNDDPKNGNFLISSAGSGTVGGPVTLNFGQGAAEVLTVGGAGKLTITGNITGQGGLTKTTNSSTTILSGTNDYTGTTTVSDGTLQIDGTQATSPVSVANSGVLSGNGTVGAITTANGSVVAPGVAIGPPVSLTANDYTGGNGSLFALTITKPAGAGSDQLVVLGTVNLTGTALNLTRTGHPVPVGQSITLIDNQGPNPITGTFAGLAQGATLTVGNQRFRIAYNGGTGNDVVITALTLPPTPQPPPPAPPPLRRLASLLNKKATKKGKAKLFIRISFSDGRPALDIQSPFQKTSGITNIQVVSADDGSVLVSAKKGKKTLTAIL